MRFMVMVRANTTSEAGLIPDQSVFESMATYHEELAKAGGLLEAMGLQPSSKGWRIRRVVAQRNLLAWYARCH